MSHAHDEIAALFERESRGLRALAGRLLNPGDADDLVQDGFLLLLRRGDRGLDRPGGWLTGSLRNLAFRARRGRRRRAVREEATATSEVAPPEPDPGHAEILSAVVEAARALDEPYREVVFRHFFQGRTLAAIARDLGCPEATVRTRLRRALSRLRDRLEGRDPEWRASLALALGLPCDVAASTSLVKSMGFVLGGLTMWKITFLVAVLTGGWLWLGGPEPSDAATDAPERAAVAIERPGPPARGAASERAEAVATAAADAADHEDEAVAEDADLVVIEGLVVDREGAAVPFAEVWDARLASDRGEPFATADAAGRFRVEVERPPFQLCARADGHAASFVETVPEGRSTVEFRLRLRGPAGRLAGRVVDATGEPVAGATVHVGHEIPAGAYRDAGRPRSLPAGPKVTTGADGRFEVGGLAAERTGIAVTRDGFAPWERVVTPTARQETPLLARLERGGTILGTVEDGEGRPIAGARVRVSLDERMFVRAHRIGAPDLETETDARGAFLLEAIPSGTARVRFEAAGRTGATVVRSIADGREERIDPTLLEPRETSGTLVDERGAPLAGWSVVSVREFGSLGPAMAGATKTSREGTFTVPGEPSDDLTLEICEPPGDGSRYVTGYPVLRMRGAEVSPDRPIVIHDWRRASATITGLVRFAEIGDAAGGRLNVEPLPLVRRMLVPHLGFSFAELMRTRQLGPFPPGSYRVSLELACGSRTLAEVTLAPGQRFDGGETWVPAAGVLRVRATSDEGERLPLAELQVASGDGASRDIRTFRAPVPEVIRLLPGRYEVTATARSGFCAAEAEVVVESGVPAELDLRLGRRATVRVGFRGVDDVPAPEPPIVLRVTDLDPTVGPDGAERVVTALSSETEVEIDAGSYLLRAEDARGRVAFATVALEDVHWGGRRAVIVRFR